MLTISDQQTHNLPSSVCNQLAWENDGVRNSGVRNRGVSSVLQDARPLSLSLSPFSLNVWVNKLGEDHGHQSVAVAITLHTIQ